MPWVMGGKRPRLSLSTALFVRSPSDALCLSSALPFRTAREKRRENRTAVTGRGVIPGRCRVVKPAMGRGCVRSGTGRGITGKSAATAGEGSRVTPKKRSPCNREMEKGHRKVTW